MTRKRTRKRTGRERAGEQEFELGDFSYSSEPEITPYLVPIGNTGFYQSPTEPVDPQDCERWPSSPYCGGTGFSPDRLGLEQEFSANPCEICMVIDPSLMFISLPPYTICKRSNSPECTVLQPQPDPPTDESESPGIGETPMPFDPEGLAGQCAGEIYIITLLGEVVSQAGESHEYTPTSRPSVVEYVRGPIRNARLVEFYRDDFYGYSLWGAALNHGGMVSRNSTWVPNSDSGYRTYTYNPSWFVSYDGSLNLRWKISRPDGRTVDYCDDPENAPIAPPVPAPPYPLNNGPCCMSCSPDSEELLRLIYRRLGADQYPIPVPQSLLANKGNGTRNLESISDFMHWFVLQFDALTGQFPIDIEVKDNDPTKEGDQREKFTIPNLAEGIAEIAGLAFSANINTQTLINALIRTLTEAGSAKIHALESRHIAQAIADYLAFDAKEVKTDVSMTFTPGQDELDEILQERDQQIPLMAYNDDRDFREEMTDLLQAAAIIRAVHYRKVGKTGDIKQELKDRFKDLIKLAEKGPDQPDITQEDPNKNDFDRFLEDAEIGFANTAGISDVLNPYGRDYSQRPKIRELGNTADNTNERL